MKTKVCPCCKEELPISEFYKDKRKRSGLHCYCQKCHIAKSVAYKKERRSITFCLLGERCLQQIVKANLWIIWRLFNGV